MSLLIDIISLASSSTFDLLIRHNVWILQIFTHITQLSTEMLNHLYFHFLMHIIIVTKIFSLK